MKKLKNIFRGIENWFKAQAKCLIYKKIIKELNVKLEDASDKIAELKTKVDNLQFEIDRDDKLQRIKYLEGRVEEQHVQKRALGDEIKELKEK